MTAKHSKESEVPEIEATEPMCADPNCGHPRYAHRVDLKTERYENCLCCRDCAGYQSAVLNAAIANLKEELRHDH